MQKLVRSARNSRSIKIGGKAGAPVANQLAKSVAKAKPIPTRQSGDPKPRQTQGTLARRFYRIRDIAGPEGILPIGISTAWRWVGQGILPQPIRLGSRCSVFDRGEIERAIEEIDKRINSKNP